jgi:hypothetical protein
VTPTSPNIESDQQEPAHEEAEPKTHSRHIPLDNLTSSQSFLACVSELGVSGFSSLVEVVDLKGYVHKMNSNNKPQEGGDVADSLRGTMPETNLWQAAQVRLRLSLSTEDFNSVVRYAALLAYDPAAGRAVLALPNAFLCKQVTTRLAFPIATALSQITGRPVQVHATVQTVGKEAIGPPSPPMRPYPRSARRQSVRGQRPAFGRSN